MGRVLKVPASPQRIVSLVPSQTELLYHLGLGDKVVGITKFCVHPADWIKEKAIVGGTKKFRFDVIKELNPHLIIGNKEENYQEGIELLEQDYPVWMSDIFDLSDALDMISSVSDISAKQREGQLLINEIKQEFSGLRTSNTGSVLYLIWKKPYMAAGPGTFIHEMMSLAGYRNCVETSRYPEVSKDDLQRMNPDHVFLSSEPYPFKTKHIAELQRMLPEAKIQLVDGEIFSWYGSRLLKLPEYLKSLQY